jgi:hypothetical protein
VTQRIANRAVSLVVTSVMTIMNAPNVAKNTSMIPLMTAFHARKYLEKTLKFWKHAKSVMVFCSSRMKMTTAEGVVKAAPSALTPKHAPNVTFSTTTVMATRSVKTA